MMLCMHMHMYSTQVKDKHMPTYCETSRTVFYYTGILSASEYYSVQEPYSLTKYISFLFRDFLLWMTRPYGMKPAYLTAVQL